MGLLKTKQKKGRSLVKIQVGKFQFVSTVWRHATKWRSKALDRHSMLEFLEPNVPSMASGSSDETKQNKKQKKKKEKVEIAKIETALETMTKNPQPPSETFKESQINIFKTKKKWTDQ